MPHSKNYYTQTAATAHPGLLEEKDRRNLTVSQRKNLAFSSFKNKLHSESAQK